MARKSVNRFFQHLPFILFIFSLCFLFFVYGFLTQRMKIFPYPLIRNAFTTASDFKDQITGQDTWFFHETELDKPVQGYDSTAVQPGLTLISSIDADKVLSVKIIDFEGEIVHQWRIDWFEIWPDCEHVKNEFVPKSLPGTQIHGIKLMPNGDIVFNFDHLGLVRMDMQGNVVWKLAHRTHHSVFVDEDGYLWVCGQIDHGGPIEGFPNLLPWLIEPLVLKVSPDTGEILRQIELFSLLKDNGYMGLLSMSSIDNKVANVTGDLLHLNDVEIFSSAMQPGVFVPGDVMVSLRNINTVLVFDPVALKIKYISTGKYVRQHDPDFIDGDHISVFDNNNQLPDANPSGKSRILVEDVTDGSVEVWYEGSNTGPFYSNLMGKHQWLENGNLLITETTKGRVFEVTPDKRIVWDYVNLIKPGYSGAIQEAIRLGDGFTREFFR